MEGHMQLIYIVRSAKKCRRFIFGLHKFCLLVARFLDFYVVYAFTAALELQGGEVLCPIPRTLASDRQKIARPNIVIIPPCWSKNIQSAIWILYFAAITPFLACVSQTEEACCFQNSCSICCCCCICLSLSAAECSREPWDIRFLAAFFIRQESAKFPQRTKLLFFISKVARSPQGIQYTQCWQRISPDQMKA